MDRALGNVRFHEGANRARKEVEDHVKKKATQISRRRSVAQMKERRKSMAKGEKLTQVRPVGGTTLSLSNRQYTIADEFATRKIGKCMMLMEIRM